MGFPPCLGLVPAFLRLLSTRLIVDRVGWGTWPPAKEFGMGFGRSRPKLGEGWVRDDQSPRIAPTLPSRPNIGPLACAVPCCPCRPSDLPSLCPWQVAVVTSLTVRQPQANFRGQSEELLTPQLAHWSELEESLVVPQGTGL